MISKWHAEAIASIEDAQLVGVADLDMSRAESCASKYSCRAFPNFDSLISSGEIDVVCICLPSGLHAEYAARAAMSGKHFIVEKPLAITKEQLDSVISACEKNHVKGCVISQMRFAPDIQKVKKAIDEGLFGDILFADLKMKYYRTKDYYSSSPWRGTKEMDGGGALMNQGIHGIDLIQYLVGPIRSVSGVCKTLVHSIEVEDSASLTVEFKSGAIGTITGSTSVYPGFPRYIEINGTKGSVALTEDKITMWSIEGDNSETKPYGNYSGISSFNDPTGISFDLHRYQIADMVSAIRTDSSPLVDIYDGKRAVDVILSAYAASEVGQKILI